MLQDVIDLDFDNVIEGSGSGGGKGGGAGSGATEAPNTLRSKATARFVELLCEGEIFGLIDGAKSIILNKVAVENADGSRNYQGFTFQSVNGLPDQSYLPGFASVTSEQTVNLRVKYATPVIYRTQAADLDAVRVTINIPALTKLNKDTGTLEGYNVAIGIDIKNVAAGSTWVEKVTSDFISGKQTGPYERAYRIGLSGSGPWLVRVRRLSVDTDDDSSIQNTTMFSHITEIQDHKVAYSDSAIVGIEVDAEQFGSNLADREYDIRGKLIQYPSNYNPTTRVYTGFWNGTWNYGFCKNPAWVFMDICTNPRYGVNIPTNLIDRWGLYELAQYCDTMVPDGKGGTEPRFLFNGEIRSREAAYKVLQGLASMMRAIVFYSAGAIILRQDAPMAPEQRIYTPANVIGDFNYSSTAKRVRHTAAVVEYVNPDLGFENDYEVYENRPAIIKYGYNSLDIKAIGTTSSGQAYRQGKWAVLTELLQTEGITFEVGFDSATVLPGDLVEVADPHWASADFGGRIRNVEGANLLSNAHVSTASKVGLSIDTPKAEGPWGALSMSRVLLDSAQTASGLHGIYRAVSVTSGVQQTWSIFVRKDNWPYVKITQNQQVSASFDLDNNKVRAKQNTDKAWIEDHGNGLYRLCITFTPTATASINFVVGPDRLSGPVMGYTNWTPATADFGHAFYAGAWQAELGAVATQPRPPITSPTTQVLLDRDIDFTGATNPQLHLTLIDGALDDVVGTDNTGNPIRRKITYFSGNVSTWDAELGMVTLSGTTPIPAGGTDGATPLVWIFSKATLAPKPFKVVSIKENDKKTYDIEAIEYSVDKFVQMDENFVITYDPGDGFTDLPSSSFCEPVSDLTVEPIQRYQDGRLQTGIAVAWTASPDKLLRGYMVSYKRNDDNWVLLPLAYETAIELMPAANGAYIFSVRAVNKFGIPSAEVRQGLNFDEGTVDSKSVITSLTTDLGGLTFTDRNVRMIWTSKALSADTQTPAVFANVIKSPQTVTSDGSGLTVDGSVAGTLSNGAVVVNIADLTAPVFTFSGSFGVGDGVRLTIGQNEFFWQNLTTAVKTASAVATELKAIIDNDVRFVTSRAAQVLTVSYADGSSNAATVQAHEDPLFAAYVIEVRDAVTDALKRTVTSVVPEYIYSYENNTLDFGAASRNLKFNVAVDDVYGNRSSPTVATVMNPPPLLVVATSVPMFGQLKLLYDPPLDPDFAGIIVWASTTNNFTPGPTNIVWQGFGQPIVSFPPGTTVYYRYAFYDLFGQVGIQVSAQQSALISAVTGSDIDNTPPNIPTGAVLTSSIVIDTATKLPYSELKLSWTAIADADLGGYEVQFKETLGGTYIGGYRVGAGFTSYTIRAKPNMVYYAQVRAIDKIGNWSGWSTAAGPTTSAKDATPPGLATWLTPETGISNAFLKWTNPSDSDLSGVEVWKSSTNTSGSAVRVAVLNAIASDIGRYSVTGLVSGSSTYYWLKTIDTSGNTSAFSASSGAVTTSSIIPADFDPTITATGYGATLPNPVGYTGPKLFYNTTDGLLYRYVGGVWTKAVNGADITTGTIPSVAIVDGAITTAKINDASLTLSKFTSSVRPIEILATLPANSNPANFDGRMVYAQDAKKLYRFDGTLAIFTASVPTSDLSGTIATAQIADAAITLAKFGSGMKPVETVAVLPTTGLVDGRVVFLSTDGKLYRYRASAPIGWTSAVPAVDLTGTITSLQIADAAITNAKLGSFSVDTAKLADNAITTAKIAANAVTAGIIADNAITLAKLNAGLTAVEILPTLPNNGNVNNFEGRQVYATDAGKLYRFVSGAFTSSVPAVDLTGNITSLQIADAAITNAKLGSLAVDAAKLASNAVTSGKIAADAVTASTIAANAVTLAKLASGLTAVEILATLPNNGAAGNFEGRQVYATDVGKLYRYVAGAFVTGPAAADISGVLADAQVGALAASKITGQLTNAQIATLDASKIAGQLTDTQIATLASTKISGQLTNAQIAALDAAKLTSQIVATQITDGAISTPKLAAGAVTAAKITANTITANEIKAATITSAEIKANTIVATNIAANAITASEIAALTIVAGNIAAGAITTAKLVANAVTANEIAAGTITATEIAGSTITGNKLVANTITAGKIAANTITAGEIAANTITAGQIAGNTITANEIATGTITAGKIAAGTITANEIGASAITASKIAANTITAGQIAAGAITGTLIAANTITASKLIVGDTSNIVNDADMQDAASWTGAFTLAATGGSGASQGIVTVTAGGTAYSSAFQVQAGKPYFASVMIAMIAASGANNIATYIEFYNNFNATTPNSTQFIGSTTGTANLTVQGTFNANNNASRAKLKFVNTGTGAAIVQEPVVRRANNGELIVDGTITTNKVATNAITANEIATNAITAGKILAGSITTAKMDVGAITANELATNAVTANKILSGAITTDKLDVGAVTAAKIATGTITANEIGAGEITAIKIATDAITAAKIVAGTITGALIAANTITASKLIVGDTSNAIPDADMVDYSSWTQPGGATFTLITSGSGSSTNKLIVATGQVVKSTEIQVQNNKPYYFSIRGAVETASAGTTCIVRVRWYSDLECKVISQTDILLSTTNTGNTEGSATFTSPSDARRCKIELVASAGTSNCRFLAPVIRRAANGELIVDGAITADKIAVNAITAGKILAGTIVAADIAGTTITADKIVTGTITALQIATGTITANEIAAGTITSAKILAGTITTANLSANVITASKLFVGDTLNFVHDPLFVDAAYWTFTLCALNTDTQITSNLGVSSGVKFEDGNGTTTQGVGSVYQINKNQYSPVEAGMTYRFYVQSRVTNGFTGQLRISADWYQQNGTTLISTTTNLGVSYRGVANAVQHIEAIEVKNVAPALAAFVRYRIQNVWSTTLANGGTVYIGNPILQRAAGAELIVDGSITALQIKANTIVASNIAAGTITATEILTGTITANQIAAGTITAGLIAANTITATQIGIGDFTNLAINGEFTYGDSGFDTPGYIVSDSVNAYSGSTYVMKRTANASSVTIQNSNVFPCKAGDEFWFNWAGKTGGALVGSLTMVIRFLDNTGAIVSNLNVGSITSNSGSYTEFAGKIVAPATATTAKLRITFANTGGTLYLGYVSIRRRAQGNLLVDGAITALQITAATITTTELAANTITANNIAANTITAGKIAANTITASEIAAGTITATEILASTITTNKINAGAITTALIAAGAVVANSIGANAIVAGKIAAGTIVAADIQANSISGDRFITTTNLPGTITVGSTGVSIATVQTQAGGPAAVVNAQSTTIDPGKILISGSTTLSNWRNGTDATKIEGGSIYANTVAANKLTIGNRGVSVEGIQFQWTGTTVTPNNRLSWTEGYVIFTDDGGVSRRQHILAGTTTFAGSARYVYWAKPPATPAVPADASLLFGTDNGTTISVGDNIILCTWYGGVNIVANYGGTIVDGSTITTGTITASQILAGSITATQISTGTITADRIVLNGISTDRLAFGGTGETSIYFQSPDFTLAGDGATWYAFQGVGLNAKQGSPMRIDWSAAAQATSGGGTCYMRVVRKTTGNADVPIYGGTAGVPIPITTNGANISGFTFDSIPALTRAQYDCQIKVPSGTSIALSYRTEQVREMTRDHFDEIQIYSPSGVGPGQGAGSGGNINGSTSTDGGTGGTTGNTGYGGGGLGRKTQLP